MMIEGLGRLTRIVILSLWIGRVSSFAVGNNKGLQIDTVTTLADWYALADVRYDEWIQASGDTSRNAFRRATVEIYQEERPESLLILAKRMEDGKVVGAAELSPLELENVIISSKSSKSKNIVKALYVTDVVTDSKYRRMGIGQTLMQALEKEAAKQRSDYMVLHVKPNNAAALTFYERLGFAGPSKKLSAILDEEQLAENAGAEGQILLSKMVVSKKRSRSSSSSSQGFGKPR